MKRFRWLILIGFLVLSGYLGWIKFRSLDVPDGGQPLAVRWEGFYHDDNFRDVAVSLNRCLETDRFQPGVLMRSAGWFSGWSCEKVGDPEIIFSLNYDPARAERYFCQSGEEKVIGRFYNPTVRLNNLEFMKTWEDPAMREATCAFLNEILEAVAAGKRVLVHCSAGRDRTGTITALIAAMAAEHRGQLDERLTTAIECDYRRTESLIESKYGRMERFINHLQAQGGVVPFIRQTCQIPADLIDRSADRLLSSVQ